MEACSAAQGSFYCAGIKSSGKCSPFLQPKQHKLNMNARLKGRDNIYKNDPWVLSVYVAHLSLTAHQLIFIFQTLSLFLPTFPQ